MEPVKVQEIIYVETVHFANLQVENGIVILIQSVVHKTLIAEIADIVMIMATVVEENIVVLVESVLK